MTNWKDRALAATKHTQFGAIIARALNTEIPAPCFISNASITSDGFVMCNFLDRDGNVRMGAFVGAASDVVRNAEGLAKHLKLSREERKELFATLHSWAPVKGLED